MVRASEHEILIVDDEADIRMLTAGLLEDEGYATREAANDRAALDAIATRRPSLVLLDIWLRDSAMDGLGILKAVKRQHPNLPVLMMSGHGTVETAVQAIQDGAYDFIEKPFKADRMMHLVGRAIETARLRQENEELRLRTATPDHLVGASAETRELQATVERVAATNSRVLVTGASGVGKELVARLIHGRSRRSGKPFVTLNCAVLEADQVAPALFGVDRGERGEGAVGILERAHEGTLFLDEVADLPLETQGRIVRALQDQVFQRVGGSRQVQVDVRVIATSSRDLTAAIEAGRFREDLYYRLNVVPVNVPPLAHRRADIEPLALHFMAEAAKQAGRPARVLSPDALAALQAYDWPGNARELRNIIERLFILAPGDGDAPITSSMLPPEITGETPSDGGGDGMAQLMGMALREAREQFERHYLERQYRRFGCNVSKTAEFVGMERSALHRKLKSLGIQTGDKAG
jgi:two-component system nitrogen regulation response regulator NtrX